MSKQIHIVHIIPTLRFGGAERMVVDLVNASDISRFRYTIIVFGHDMPLADQITRPDVRIEIIEKQGKLSFGLFVGLVRLLKKIQPDIVHTHLFGGDIWGRAAAWYLRIPVVTTEHNINQGEGMVKRFLKILTCRMSDNYVACSAAVSLYVQEVYGVKKPIEVIHYGVHLENLSALPTPQIEKQRLLILGRLTEQKGHVVALRALANLKNYQWTLDIVGDGELKSEIENEIKRLDLSLRVRLYPANSNVPKIISEHDIVLMPSLWEGLGIVAMESMAAGRILIASDADGLREIIVSHETGILSPVNNIEQLSKNIQWVFDNTVQAAKISAAAKETAKKFAMSRMIGEYESIYEKICPQIAGTSVLYLMARFTTGGAERLVLEYVRRLSADGAPVAVASIVGGGEMKSEFASYGIPMIIGERSLFGIWRTWRSLVVLIRKQKPTIVHSHLYSGDVFGWIVKTLLAPRARWVTTQHNVRESSTRLRQIILRFILKKADVVIAVSDSVAAFCHSLSVRSDKLFVVQNSIPIDEWLVMPTEKLLSDKKIHLATIGRLEYQKGHDILFRALAKLPADSWQLEVFGSGSRREELVQLAEKLGIAKNIVWYGVVHNFIGQLSSVDVVVQPSRFEGMSLAIMESMAAGRVVIASTPAGEGIIHDKKTGFIVPVEDAETLARTIQFVIDHPEEAVSVAKQAREYAKESFSFAKHWDGIVRVYESK
ncbi:MAG: glycosyltransferase [Candidatus Magasanikbacteria bacterium]|nr:glycosyltransferase [Candidatus Magasanikbacteria bacterium]